MLQIRNITKTYKTGKSSVVALDNINIDFPEKGLVFIVGKSGSGKSTLLNILGGLDKMDCGEIIIDGNSTKDFSASDFNAYRNYHVGFIFQEFNLIDDISVKDNIAISLKIQAKEHDLTTIDEALKLVNLEGLGYRSPRELSGGQKQRIAVARALVKNPRIILADEPTGALDSKTGYELMSSFKTLAKDKLVIIVTHDDEFANLFGDEIIHLSDGHLVSHQVISSEYKMPEIEKITDNIIKIPAGKTIDDKSIIDNSLKDNEINYVCLTSSAESITIAHPEIYDEVFKKEDLSKKFSNKEKGSTNYQENSKKHFEKAKISLKECFKMAFHQYKKHFNRVVFLLLFTILSISILGFSYSLSSVSNSKITANTLTNNEIGLGIMRKIDEYGIASLSTEEVDLLDNKYDNNNFAIGKEVDFSYSAVNLKADSSFAMGTFKGVVECNDVRNLNLNIISGENSAFDKSSLDNHEIVISDYAAYELRRTGYLGYGLDGKYGVVEPKTLQEQIGTHVLINNIYYKIRAVFDTNFEDFLPLLINEGYTEDSDKLDASLGALKTYYYARIFAPVGFYEKYMEETKTSAKVFQFKASAEEITIYTTKKDEDGTIILGPAATSKIDLTSTNIDSFRSFSSVKDKFSYTVKWGNIPSTLKDNQIVVSSNWLKRFKEPVQIEAAVSEIEEKLEITKTDSTGTYQLLKEKVEIVAVINIDNTVIDPTVPDFAKEYYYDIPMFYSDKLARKLTLGIYDYNQIFFTLSGNQSSYEATIKNMVNEGYNVLNIDGQETLSNADISKYKTISLVVSIVMFIFAFLIMINFVSSNVKAREKEIGILRATGARRRDILKIFAVEEGMIALIVSILSTLIVGYVASILNSSIGNVELGVQILVFDYINVLIIIAMSLAFFAITTLIPLISILKLKPIDAIRKA